MDTIYEAYYTIVEEGKDEDRINNIIIRAKGDEKKERKLALNMANSIKGLVKAKARHKASEKLLTADHVITKEFANRVAELDGTNDKIRKKNADKPSFSKDLRTLNIEIINYAKKSGMMEFKQVFAGVKRGYRASFRKEIHDGGWYKMGRKPSVDGPEDIQSPYGANVIKSGWCIVKGSYLFKVYGHMQDVEKGVSLHVWIESENKMALAWNSDGWRPLTKVALKDKNLKAKIWKIATGAKQ